MVNYADEFGLPKDRMKLTAIDNSFNIKKISIVQSKKKYKTTEEGIDGNLKVIQKPIDIAYLDVLFEGEDEIKKYYSPNSAIVIACKDILKKYGRADGSLKEDIYINEVKEGISEAKNIYLFFT